MKYYSLRKLFVVPLWLSFLLGVTILGVAQEIKVDNTAKYVGNGRYDWTVSIVADKSVLSKIQAVEYTLHPTFPDPVRRGTGPRFSISANGWGEFSIKVKIIYKDRNRSPTTLNYWLRLFEKSRVSKTMSY